MCCKERLLMNMSKRLIEKGYDPEQTKNITDMLLFELANYSVAEECTEIVTYDNESEQLIKLYSATLLTQGLARGTVENYARVLERFRTDMNKPLKEVGVYDVRIWLANEQTRVSLRTSDGFRTALLCFYNWMTAEGMITVNPMLNIKPIKFPEEVKFPFSDIEIDQLKSVCKTLRERAEIELLLSSGLRVSELCALNLNDVNFDTNEVHVRKGKGGKGRVTFMSSVCAMHLKKYLESRKDDSACMFYTKFNGRLSVKACQDDLKKLGSRAGVTNVHPHRCRRTFATSLWKKGMDIRSIQVLMGHSNLNTTMEYITGDMEHVSNEYKRHA